MEKRLLALVEQEKEIADALFAARQRQDKDGLSLSTRRGLVEALSAGRKNALAMEAAASRTVSFFGSFRGSLAPHEVQRQA
eukprot:gene31985-38674_t